MQRHREKGMVTMMSRTERAVRMKAVMPGSPSSAARERRKGTGNQAAFDSEKGRRNRVKE